MFRRLLSGRSTTSTPVVESADSYAEGMLDRVLDRFGESAPDPITLLDPLVAVGGALCDLEVEDGQSPPPEPPDRTQFVRTYTKLLLDNDRQPRALQLTAEELALPRALLQSFFTRGATMQLDATKVLRFIEQRFSSGRFGQARLLLQLFETDQQTRRNNERNLFFEEMVLRFLSVRSAPAHTLEDPDAGLGKTLRANGIQLNTLGPDQGRQAAWKSGLEETLDDAQLDVLLRFVPGFRWRPHWTAADPLAALRDHFGEQDAREFVRQLTLRVYFITLYPGATGFEYLVVKYMEWMAERFEMIPTRILPRLHRESTLGQISIDESLAVILDELFSTTSMPLGPVDDDALIAAFHATEDLLEDLDIADTAAAEYDLGGIVSYQLFEFDPGTAEALLRLNRLT